jgi:hypothetical protein
MTFGLSYRPQAERAIASVVEAECPMCKVELLVHDDRACCPCCGDSYKASGSSLEIRPCPEHVRFCHHWKAVWEHGATEGADGA